MVIKTFLLSRFHFRATFRASCGLVGYAATFDMSSLNYELSFEPETSSEGNSHWAISVMLRSATALLISLSPFGDRQMISFSERAGVGGAAGIPLR